MWLNYLKLSFRHFLKNKFYFLVNIIGLAVALACCLIAFQNYRYDAGFDTMHQNAEEIFRVTSIRESNDQLYGISPLPLATVAQDDLTEVVKSSSVIFRSDVIKTDYEIIKEDICYATHAFLEMFTFPVKYGNAKALSDPSKILLTEAAAKKFFGEENPVGKEILLHADRPEKKPLEVGAVLYDGALNSSVRFDLLTNQQNVLNDKGPIDMNAWSAFAAATFLQLRNPANSRNVSSQLNAYVPAQNKAREDWKIKSMALDPLLETAANGREIRVNYLMANFPREAVWGPNILAILLLLAACLNFANTTVTLFSSRLREIGIRKVMGGSRQQVLRQILGETLLVSGLAVALGIIVAEFFLPIYNAMWPYLELDLNYLSQWPLMLFVITVLLATTILSGMYPAIYVTAFNPTEIFSGKIKYGGSHLVSRILLGVQLAIALIAMIGGISFARNAHFQKYADLGYNREQIIGVPTYDVTSADAFRNQIEQNPMVLDVVSTRAHVSHYYARQSLNDLGVEKEVDVFDVGKGYMDIMDFEIVAGSGFNENLKLDDETALVNERFIIEFGWEDALGRTVTVGEKDYVVRGVVKDFVTESVFDEIEPLLFKMSPEESHYYLVVKTTQDDMVDLYADLKKEWSALYPFNPFGGFYQNESLASGLTVVGNIKDLFIFMALVTFLLTITGLIALVSLNIVKRQKELAIRKVLGATMAQITYLLNRAYLFIFLGCAVIGVIGGSFLAQKLLSGIFSTHLAVSYPLAVSCSLLVIVIAVLTIGVKLVEVARTNPSDILRSE